MAKTPDNARINLQSIVYPHVGGWIAHCLEMDIVAEGESSDEAIGNLIDLCKFQIDVALEEGDLESIFRPAPAQIWKLFSLAEDRTPPKKSPKPVHRFEARKLELV